MISEHIKRNTYYNFVFNQADAESVYWALKTLQIDPKNARLLSSLTSGVCIFRQSDASWPNAFLCKIDYIPPARNIGTVEYDQHDFVPAISNEQSNKIIEELYKLVDQNKNENKSSNKKSDIEELALKLIELWAKNPYTLVARLFEKLGNLHHKVQFEIREYIEKKNWAEFEETRIGRSNMLLMELTSDGYKALKMPVPSGNKGRGSLTHRTFGFTIMKSLMAKGFKAYLEWIVPNTTHPVDIAVEVDGHMEAYEIAITAFSNIRNHLEACFEKSDTIKKLTIVVATKNKLKELKKQIKNDLMLARYKDEIQLDIIENYMKRSKNEN